MPQPRNTMSAASVSPPYMRNKTLVISWSRGSTRSLVGPATSALYKEIVACPASGSKAMKMTTMPKPPSQCVILRQNKMLCGKISRSSMTVAPVPVNPDMLSNNPSRIPKQPLNT